VDSLKERPSGQQGCDRMGLFGTVTKEEQEAMASSPPVFALRLVAEPGTNTGAIVLECDNGAEADTFFTTFIEFMYPPGERGRTLFAVQSGDPGVFLLEASSSSGSAKIYLRGVTPKSLRLLRQPLLPADQYSLSLMVEKMMAWSC
jgi:hypothetical protein